MASKSPPSSADQDLAWTPARIIPTSGIGGQEEQEKRATSALLAVISAVPDFGKAVIAHLGAPAGKVSTFVEVRLKDPAGKVSIPDGAIVVQRGKTRWSCLVEVKTANALLDRDQVDRYVDHARDHGFDGVLTISNEITSTPSDLPISLDGRKLRRTTVRHLSWWQLLTEAIVVREHRGVSDPDQAWILGELIAYLDNDRSGAGGFEDMGPHWTTVRDAARQGTLGSGDPGVAAVCERWEQLLQYLVLGLRQDLGRPVALAVGRSSTVKERLEGSSAGLCADGRLTSSVKIPDAVAAIALEANLRSRLVTASAEVVLPKEGRPKTRLNWLVRQLGAAPSDVRLEVQYPNVREPVVATLGQAREQPEVLLWPGDFKREPRSCRVCLSKELGTKRGKGPGSFVYSTKAQVITFYRDVLQPISGWQPKAPRLTGERASDVPFDRDSPLAVDTGSNVEGVPDLVTAP